MSATGIIGRVSESRSSAPVIYVSAVVITDIDDRLLLVRKRGTTTFMLPGGKFETGESPVDAAIRESAEEVGVVVTDGELQLMGHFLADAANEPDHLVDAHVYRVVGTRDAGQVLADLPESEIAEVRWVDMPDQSDGLALAPLLTDHVWPMLSGGSV